MIVGGQEVDSPQRLEVRNPFDGRVIDTVPLASPEHRERAVQIAQGGLRQMRALPAHERGAILLGVSRLLAEHAEETANLIAMESGKTVPEARVEVARAVQTFLLSAEEARRIHGETVPLEAAPGAEGKFGYYVREPVGVVLAITPFNFPLNLPAHKIGPALAAGCSVIFKPASATPLTGLRLGQMLLECGVPGPAISVLTGSSEVLGDPLVADPRIRKVSFTGSTAVGKHLATIAGLKRLTLELGGNSAVVIMADGDLQAAAERIKVGGYAHAGQVCISVQRVFVQRPVLADFLALLEPLVRGLKAGDQLLPDTDVGPLITEQAALETEQRIQQAVSEGAELVCGGQRKGSVITPAILTNVPEANYLYSEEAFAPLVVVGEFQTLEQAIQMVNSSHYGLQAGIYTRSVDTAFEFARRAEVGGVMVNEIPSFRADLMPYGGVKDSGLGREGVKYAVQEMTELKVVVWNLA